METPKRAAIYARTATVQETGQSFATDAQIHACQAFIINQGYTLVEGLAYKEIGNGATLTRPGLTTLRDGARNHEFDVVVVYAFDRLARTPAHFATLLSEFESVGVRVESVREPFPADIHICTLLIHTHAYISQMEREKVGRRTRGRQQKEQ